VVLYAGCEWTVAKANGGADPSNPQITLYSPNATPVSPRLSSVQFLRRKQATRPLGFAGQAFDQKAHINEAEALPNADRRAAEKLAESLEPESAEEEEIEKAKPAEVDGEKESKPLGSDAATGEEAALAPTAVEAAVEVLKPEVAEDEAKSDKPAEVAAVEESKPLVFDPASAEDQAALVHFVAVSDADKGKEKDEENPELTTDVEEIKENMVPQTANSSSSAAEEPELLAEPSLEELEELQLLLQAYSKRRALDVRKAIAKRTVRYFPLRD